MDVKAGQDILKGVLETLDVGVKLADVVLGPFDPTLLLSKALTTFLLAVADKLRNFMGQSFVLHIVDFRKGGADGGDNGGGEGSHM